MKSIIKSFLIIVAVAAVAGGATFAVFTAQDEIAGNTISAATLALFAQGESDQTTLAKPINDSGLFPGQWSEWFRGVVRNESPDDIAMDVYMYVDPQSLDGAACDQTNIKIMTGNAGSYNEWGERSQELFNGDLGLLIGEENMIKVNGDGSPFENGIPSGWSQVLQQTAQLNEDADNSYQGTSCTWDEVFVGYATESGLTN